MMMVFPVVGMLFMTVAVLRGFFEPFLHVFAVNLLFGQARSSSNCRKKAYLSRHK